MTTNRYDRHKRVGTQTELALREYTIQQVGTKATQSTAKPASVCRQLLEASSERLTSRVSQTRDSHVGRGCGGKANPQVNNKIHFPSNILLSGLWNMLPQERQGSSWDGMQRDVLVFKDFANFLWYLELRSQWWVNNAIGPIGPAPPVPSDPHNHLAMPLQEQFFCLAF